MKKISVLVLLTFLFFADKGSFAYENNVFNMNSCVQDSSVYTLNIKDSSYSKSSSIHIKVIDIDSDNMPVQAMIMLQDNKKRPVSIFFTDKQGICDVILYKSKKIRYLTIGNIGYDKVTITLSKVNNIQSAELIVKLKGQGTID